MTLNEFLLWLKKLIEETAPAIAVMLWNYEESQVQEAKNEALDAKVNLDLEKNHESVEQKYHDCPDIAIVDDAINADNGGSGQSGSRSKNGNGTSGTGN